MMFLSLITYDTQLRGFVNKGFELVTIGILPRLYNLLLSY